MLCSNCGFSSMQQVSKYPLILIIREDSSRPWKFGTIWVQPSLCGLREPRHRDLLIVMGSLLPVQLLGSIKGCRGVWSRILSCWINSEHAVDA